MWFWPVTGPALNFCCEMASITYRFNHWTMSNCFHPDVRLLFASFNQKNVWPNGEKTKSLWFAGFSCLLFRGKYKKNLQKKTEFSVNNHFPNESKTKLCSNCFSNINLIRSNTIGVSSAHPQQKKSDRRNGKSKCEWMSKTLERSLVRDRLRKFDVIVNHNVPLPVNCKLIKLFVRHCAIQTSTVCFLYRREYEHTRWLRKNTKKWIFWYSLYCA